MAIDDMRFPWPAPAEPRGGPRWWLVLGVVGVALAGLAEVAVLVAHEPRVVPIVRQPGPTGRP
jgi:hypothetical protein